MVGWFDGDEVGKLKGLLEGNEVGIDDGVLLGEIEGEGSSGKRAWKKGRGKVGGIFRWTHSR